MINAFYTFNELRVHTNTCNMQTYTYYTKNDKKELESEANLRYDLQESEGEGG